MESDESSLEFDMFEEVRLTLTRVLTHQGREPVEAERIAFYVVQGIRQVPKLLTVLSRGLVKEAEVRQLLDVVLENAAALGKARAMLLGSDD